MKNGITTALIKQLRDQTGVSIMLCRKALEEAGGDLEKATLILRREGANATAKKAGRLLGAGTVAAYIHHDGGVGALVELSSETDFVSNNEEFRALARELAMQVAAGSPEFVSRAHMTEEAKKGAREALMKEVEGLPAGKASKPATLSGNIVEDKLDAHFAERILLEQPYIKNPEITVQTLIEQAVQKFGEKVEITRFARFAVGH